MKLEKISFEQANGIIEDEAKYGFDYPFWDYDDLSELMFASLYTSDNIIGMISYIIDPDEKEVEIMIMEIPDKYRNMGYGTIAVNKFSQYIKDFIGQHILKVLSVPEAVPFWNKIFGCNYDIDEDTLIYYSKEIK